MDAFGVRVRLTADCADACAVLDEYAFPWLPRVEIGTSLPDLAVCIDRTAGEFFLSVDDRVVDAASEALGLVRGLIQALDEAVVQRLNALCAAHAGAVRWRGRVLLFPGASHAGKSALVAEFLRRGATYYSDEYALIDADGWVHPYPRPLLVRNGGLQQHPVLARHLNAPIGDAPAPLGWIFALRYGPEDGWNVAPVSQGEALMTLLRNTPHRLAERPALVSVFQRAVSRAQCLAGSRAEAAEAVDAMLQFVDN